jgi:hypothetical protein
MTSHRRYRVCIAASAVVVEAAMWCLRDVSLDEGISRRSAPPIDEPGRDAKWVVATPEHARYTPARRRTRDGGPGCQNET